MSVNVIRGSLRKMVKTERNSVITRPSEERVKDFNEVSQGFTYELMKAEAERCINCKNAPCTTGCPVGVKIPEFIQCLKNDDLDGAVKIIKLDNNLPSICGRVCPQEKQCEDKCIRKLKLGGSVAIGSLERYVGDYALSDNKPVLKPSTKLNYKVAVIGSGPSGLTCAADCANAGLDVTIFEAFHQAGGVLVYGIPEFRLPKEEIVKKEIDKLVELGVKIKYNTVIGKTIKIEELLEEFDAIFIGTGAGLPSFMNIEGENLNGVYSANEFLTRVNLMKAFKAGADTPVYVGKNVAIVGAGNVAMDAARTAKRLGAENVYIVYRRSKEEMPARIEEIEHAIEEGIELKLLTNPIRILGDSCVEGMECIQMELGEPDASGRRRPVEIPNSEYVIPVDEVIMSIGTRPNPLLTREFKALETTKRGTLIVSEETQETSVKNIFAGGDAVTGAATVILAMGAGKSAGKTIIARANGKNIK